MPLSYALLIKKVAKSKLWVLDISRAVMLVINLFPKHSVPAFLIDDRLTRLPSQVWN